MLKKAALVVALHYFLFTSLALSQNQGHFDASFNGGPVIHQGGQRKWHSTERNHWGELFRHFPLQVQDQVQELAWVFNYGYAKNSQVYQSNFDLPPTGLRFTSTRGAYVRNFYEKGEIPAFVSGRSRGA